MAARRLPDLAGVVGVAEQHLEPLGNRWIHTQGVGARAAALAEAVPPEDRQLLVVAAWWHDIGYSPAIRDTGFHALDGAAWLAALSYPDRLCGLIAHHSAAVYEARERGLSLDRWHDEGSAVTDALWAADMTTGPAGERVSYRQRRNEILDRYEPGSPVHRAMTAAQSAIEKAIERTADRLGRPEVLGRGDLGD